MSFVTCVEPLPQILSANASDHIIYFPHEIDNTTTEFVATLRTPGWYHACSTTWHGVVLHNMFMSILKLKSLMIVLGVLVNHLVEEGSRLATDIALQKWCILLTKRQNSAQVIDNDRLGQCFQVFNGHNPWRHPSLTVGTFNRFAVWYLDQEVTININNDTMIIDGNLNL